VSEQPQHPALINLEKKEKNFLTLIQSGQLILQKPKNPFLDIGQCIAWVNQVLTVLAFHNLSLHHSQLVIISERENISHPMYFKQCLAILVSAKKTLNI